MFRIAFNRGGVHLPELGLWLDAPDPQTGPERVFVSHAHSDHVAAHREAIVSAPTSKLMQARMPGSRFEHVLPFGQPSGFEHEGTEFQITLVPAGHIFGSAMSLIEAGGESLLYTGDFKLRRGLSAERCEPRRAGVLIMETTFGRPHYVFPPADAVLQGVIRFCREALDNDETAVLLGYSLGKSQELLCGLGDAGLPLMLHGAVHRLTLIYEQFGQCFPKYDRYDSGSARGKVLLCPPHVINSAMLRNLGRTRTAILTGWAVDPGCRYRYRCDAAFPLSDHADFPDLVEMVKRVAPKKVYTLHGFAADFARHLRTLGFDAQALSENEQFALPFLHETPTPRAQNPGRCDVVEPINPGEAAALLAEPKDSASQFLEFARTCARLCSTSSKLEKIRILAEYLRSLHDENVAIAAHWFSGRPFGAAQNKTLQVGWAVLRDAVCAVAGTDDARFHQVYLKHSDLGETVFEILEALTPKASVGVGDVDALFHQLHSARGPSGKRPLLIGIFKRCSALEAKYLVKIITGDLRIGLKEGLVEDAIAVAFAQPADAVRGANLLLGDVGETARLASRKALAEASLVPFRPIKFMLASPEETAADIVSRARGWHVSTDLNSSAAASIDVPTARRPGAQRVAAQWLRCENFSPPVAVQPLRPGTAGGPTVGTGEFRVWIEDKYDGVRCQLHKAGARVELYSRDLKEITATFVELANAARAVPEEFILDGEIVAMRGEEVLPFAELQKRLGRREHDLFMRDEVPIRFVAFDLLWLDGKSLLEESLKERRAGLDHLRLPTGFQLARVTDAGSAEEIEAAFSAARDRGNEGLMIKDPASSYLPGRRGMAWLKFKKALATLDCVVVGAEYGHGKRSKVLSDYTFAVRDERTGELRTIGKAYSGLTDLEIAQLTAHFLGKVIRQRGRYFEVEPDTVLEIAFDRIQPSDRHNSGLAMRFPRIARIRTDKSPAEIDTLAAAQRLVKR